MDNITLPKAVAEQVEDILVDAGIRQNKTGDRSFSKDELSKISALTLASIEQVDVLKHFPNLKDLKIGCYNTNRVFYPMKQEDWNTLLSCADGIENLEITNLFGLTEFDASKFKNLKTLKLASCQDLRTLKNVEKLTNIQLLGNEFLKYDFGLIGKKIIENYKNGVDVVCQCDIGRSCEIMNTIYPLMQQDEKFLKYVGKNVKFKQTLFNGLSVDYHLFDVLELTEKTNKIISKIIKPEDDKIQKTMSILVWLNKNARIDFLNTSQLDDKIHMKYIPEDVYLKNKEGEYPYSECGVYGPIMEGKTICEGAARAFNYLCRAAGVETSFIQIHMTNKSFYAEKQKNERVNENIHPSHIMTVVHFGKDSGTVVDPLGIMRKLDNKLMDVFNYGFREEDLANSGCVVKHAHFPKTTKLISYNKILSTTKTAYQRVYDTSNPEKFRNDIITKIKTRKEQKQQDIKMREKIMDTTNTADAGLLLGAMKVK